MRQLPSVTCAPTSSVESDDIMAHEAIDGTGKKCIDCSHTTHVAYSTKFSHTLYVIGHREEQPQTLFASLSRKLLRNVPWMLHVYVVPDLAAALAHNDNEMANRSASGRLPTSYAGLPEQPQSHIFLYFDEHMAWEAGPKIVTRAATMTDSVLEVMHAGGWDNATQMLFTYLAVCAETPRYTALELSIGQIWLTSS